VNLLRWVDNGIFRDLLTISGPLLVGDTLLVRSPWATPTGAASSSDLHLRTLWRVNASLHLVCVGYWRVLWIILFC
jgi:hypothetical protein